MDLAQALNAGEDVALSGTTYRLRQLTLAEWAKLQAWLKAACPSPVTQALRAVQEARDLGVPLAPDVRDQLLDHAQDLARRWPPEFGGRAWLRAVDAAPGGPAEFVRHCLGCAGYRLTEGEARGLAERLTAAEVDELVRVVYLGDPPAVPDREPEEEKGPKAPAGAGGTTGARRSTPSRPGAGRTRRSAG